MHHHHHHRYHQCRCHIRQHQFLHCHHHPNVTTNTTYHHHRYHHPRRYRSHHHHGHMATIFDEPIKITYENLHQGNPTETMIRFLKARDGNISKSHKMLVDCLNWRIENQIDKILSKPIIPVEAYRSVRDSQLIGMSGYTKNGRPVIAVGVGLSTYDKASIHSYVQSHIQINEYRDRIILLLTVISSIDDLNYPEKTDTYYIVNAPYVFSACWKVVKPLLQERTRKKVQVLSGCGKDDLLKIMDYESLPHFCRRQGSGSSKLTRNNTGDDSCFSLDHGFHQQLYNYMNQQAMGVKPRAPLKQGSFHVGFPEPDLMDCKIVQTIETEFHKMENQNGFTKIINDHPFPYQPISPKLAQIIPTSTISTSFIENVLGHLFASHSNGLKAYEFFKFSLQFSQFCPSSDAFEKTLHILTRMRNFNKAWDLIEEVHKTHPSLITLKSMSIMLSRIAKFKSFEETLEAFQKMEDKLSDCKQFGTDEFNLLLKAFCTQRQMKEAKSVFNKLYSRFPPTTKTMNILLLGFKESGDVTSVELFYHEMIRRGFKPNTVTYNIRIDSYCKKGRFLDGLKLLEEMEQVNCSPTLKTITTLIHGAGIAHNITYAQQLFDEMPKRNLLPDSGVYNALMNAFIRSHDINSATKLLDEMESNNLLHDNITYHTMFSGLMKSTGINGVLDLYNKMISKNFVPKSETVVMLIKLFCKNHKVDDALCFWRYLIDKGYCPHSHAVDVIVRSLCSNGRVEEAFECSLQILERGRYLSKTCFCVLERHLKMGDEDKLEKINKMIKKLQTVVHPSKGHANGVSSVM